ncbi:MAG: hypothetical protein KTR14_01080 [Vampirovibrio sp.]|nr:hypothetical protein [Vampirovibrio sp.]
MSQQPSSLHESYGRQQEVEAGSDRNFGWTFAVVFLVLGIAIPLLKHEAIQIWPFWVSGVFAVITMVAPKLLAPLKLIWFKFGLLLHKIISPIILGIIYYGIFTPTGLILKMLGKDLLRLKLDKSANTYWIHREPPGPPPESMINQY